MQKAFTDMFELDSVVKTLVLCVLTLGAYLIFKLYKFTRQINHYTEFKISNVFISLAIVLYAVSLSSLIYSLTNFHDHSVLESSIGIHALSSVFDITWIVMVRNRLNLILGTNKGDRLWLNPFITSIFHVIYFQHKINQGLAKNVI